MSPLGLAFATVTALRPSVQTTLDLWLAGESDYDY